MKSLLNALWYLHGVLLCSAAAAVSVVPGDIDKAIVLANTLDGRANKPPPPGEKFFAELSGSQPVIVTAPHATRTVRNGVTRFSDGGGTGALAAALHAKCGVTVLYTAWKSPSDANHVPNNALKRRLGELIAAQAPVLVLDIHGSHPHRPYDVDLGTMHGESVEPDPAIVPQLTAALRTAGLMNVSDNHFPAAGPHTITRFARAKDVAAVQLEFSRTRLEPQGSRLDAHLFAQALEGVVKFLDGRGWCGVAAGDPAVEEEP